MNLKNSILHKQLFLFSIFIWTFSGCSVNDISQNKQDNTGFPDAVLYEAIVTYTNANLKKFDVSAPEIQRFDTNDLLMLNGGIKVNFYDSFGRHSGILTADSGEVVESKQHLLARGNVIVHSDSGYSLYSDTLFYDPTAKQIRSDGFVTIIGPADSLSGYGFQASPDLSDWEIRNSGGVTRRRINSNED